MNGEFLALERFEKGKMRMKKRRGIDGLAGGSALYASNLVL